MSRRMDCVVPDSLGGVFPNQVYATLVIRACSVTLVQPCREDLSIDSRVHGNRTLSAEARSYHYKPLLLNCWFRVFFLAGMSREGTRRHCYVLLQLTIIQCCSNFCCIVILISVDINCWSILTPCCKTSSEDASLR